MTFADSYKKWFGVGFFKNETRRNREGKKINNENRTAEVVYRKYKRLASEFEPDGDTLTQEQIDRLYNRHFVLKPEEIDIGDRRNININSIVRDNRIYTDETWKEYEQDMKERYSKSMLESIKYWIIYFQRICKDSLKKGENKKFTIYSMIFRDVIQRNSVWEKRSKNDRSEYPTFHPDLTPKAIEIILHLLLDDDAFVTSRWIKNPKILQILSKPEGKIGKLLQEITKILFFSEHENRVTLMENSGRYVWVNFPRGPRPGEKVVENSLSADVGILFSECKNICLSGRYVAWADYLQHGHLKVFGQIVEDEGMNGKKIKILKPKAIYYEDKYGTLREFRGISEFQEIDTETLSKMIDNKSTPKIILDKIYSRGDSTASLINPVYNSTRFSEMLEKLKMGMILTENDLSFLENINEDSGTVGIKSVIFLKEEILRRNKKLLEKQTD